MLGVQAIGDLGHARELEGAGGDHDLVGLVGAIVELDEVAAIALPDGADAAAQLDRQLEVARVVGEVGDDVVAARVACPGLRGTPGPEGCRSGPG